MNKPSVNSAKNLLNTSPFAAFIIFVVSELLRSATHGFSTINLFVDPTAPILVPGILLFLASRTSLPRTARLLMPTFALLFMTSNFFKGYVADIVFNLISLAAIGLSLRSTVNENALIGNQVSPTAPTSGYPQNSYKNPETQKRNGLLVLAASPFVAFSPLIIGVAGATLFCGPDANEANCGFAALPWMLIASIPGSLVMAIVGLVMFIVASKKAPVPNFPQNPPTPQEQSDPTTTN